MSFFSLGSLGTADDAGSLFIGPRPKAHNLQEWCRNAKSANIQHVVSLLEEDEAFRAGLAAEQERLAELKIGFDRFPIADYGTPDPHALAALLGTISTKLAAGQNVMIHCAGGVGRAGTVASCHFIGAGWTAADAISHVSSSRGKTVPETLAQAEFIEKWANLRDA